jgi:hypothetical protein
METRIRLPEGQGVGSLAPLELLDLYWRSNHEDAAEIEDLLKLAGSVLHEGEA